MKNKIWSLCMVWKTTDDLTLYYLSDLISYHCPSVSQPLCLEVPLTHTSLHFQNPCTLQALWLKCSLLGICEPYSLQYHFIREDFPVHPKYHHFSYLPFLLAFFTQQLLSPASCTFIHSLNTSSSTTVRAMMAEKHTCVTHCHFISTWLHAETPALLYALLMVTVLTCLIKITHFRDK